MVFGDFVIVTIQNFEVFIKVYVKLFDTVAAAVKRLKTFVIVHLKRDDLVIGAVQYLFFILECNFLREQMFY